MTCVVWLGRWEALENHANKHKFNGTITTQIKMNDPQYTGKLAATWFDLPESSTELNLFRLT